MDLSKLCVQARLRSPWEAIDLGLVMARVWWWPLFLSWLIPSVFVFVPCWLLWGETIWAAVLPVWLLQPLFDRGPLFIASRRIFGEPVGVADFLRQLKAVYKTDAFFSVAVRRFSPTRSFDLPLTVLEQLKGQQRSMRQSALHRVYASAAGSLTFVAFCIQCLLILAVGVLVSMFIPTEAAVDSWSAVWEPSAFVSYLEALIIYLVMAVMAPLYVTAGFALYINRRIELEAWDIEIRFRHLVMRTAQTIKPLVIVTALTLYCGSFLSFMVPGEARASDEISVAAETGADVVEFDDTASDGAAMELESAPKRRVLEILEGEEFNRKETVKGWRFKELDDDKETQQIPEWIVSFFKFLENLAGFLKTLGKAVASPFVLLKYLVITALIILAIYIIYRYRTPLKQWVFAGAAESPLQDAPKVMFGLDVTRESLPDDVPAQAWHLWECKSYRASISLLYRALLAELIHRHGFEFSESATEGECVSLVRARADSRLTRYTVLLTSVWQTLAYGHLQPEPQQVRALCDQWAEVFADE